MKIRSILIAAALIITGAVAYEYANVSPALEVIASDLTTVKSISIGDEISFDGEEFDNTAGVRVKSITVLSLPESGKLMLGDTYVSKGQIISHSSLDGLRYFFDDGNKEAFFEYGYMSMGNGYTAVCEMYRLSDHNLPPIFTPDKSDEFVTVSSGANHFGCISVRDPESDEIRISISAYPKNGVLTVMSEGREYRYRSDEGYMGNDSFSLVAYDKYNNRSENYTVNISVIDTDGRSYADMKDSKAESASEVLSHKNIMSGYTLGGIGYFEPDSVVSREDFVAAALSAAGIAPDKYTGATAFVDDCDIDGERLAFVGYAFENGWLSDDICGAVNYFNPKEGITYESALSFVYEMLGITPSLPLSFEMTDCLTGESAALLLEKVLSYSISQTR